MSDFYYERLRRSRFLFFVVGLLLFVGFFAYPVYAALTSVSLNSGTTTLAITSDLTSSLTGLGGTDTAVYEWRTGASAATKLFALNIPFDDGANPTDFSGNSGSVTNSGTPTHATSGCRVGTCYTFDGSDDYVEIADSVATGVDTEFTVEAWVKYTASQTGVIVSKRNHAPSNYEQFTLAVMNNDNGCVNGSWTDGTAICFFLATASGTDGIVTSAATYNDDAWHHVVATRNSSRFQLFIDGTLIDVQYLAGSVDNSNPTRIGALSTNGAASTFFTGSIDEVRIYNRELSYDQVASNTTDGTNGVGGPITIKDPQSSDVWDLYVTDISSAGTKGGSAVQSGNQVTITGNEVTLNSGTTTLSVDSNLTSQFNVVGGGIGVYRWKIDSTELMALNLPFDKGMVDSNPDYVNDYSGNALAVNYYNTPLLTTGCKVGSCFTFDENDSDYLEILHTNAIDLDTNFSVEFWMNTSTVDSSEWETLIAKRKPAPSSTQWAFYVAPPNGCTGSGDGTHDDICFFLSNASDNDGISTSGNYADGSWHHVLGTKSGTAVTLYVDGSSVGTATFNGSASTATWENALRIGAESGLTTPTVGFYDGKLDEIRLYNRALTSGQVTQLYTEGNSGVGGPATIVAAETGLTEVWSLPAVTRLGADGSVWKSNAGNNTATIQAAGGCSLTAPGSRNLYLASDGTTDVASNSQTGVKSVRFDHGGYRVADFNFDFDGGSCDLSGISTQSNAATGAALVHGLATHGGFNGSSYTMYVPKLASQNSLRICSGKADIGCTATSDSGRAWSALFNDSGTLLATNANFNNGAGFDASGITVTIESGYWKVVGVTGTAGQGQGGGLVSFELENNTKSTAGWFKITMTPDQALPANSTLDILFPTGFSLATMDYTDVDVTDDGTEMTMAAAVSSTEWGVSRQSDTLLRLTIDNDTAVAANSTLVIEVGDIATYDDGTGVDSVLTNPSTVSTTDDPYQIKLTSSGSWGTKWLAAAITDDTSVNLELVVLSHLTFSISSLDLTLADAQSQELDHQNEVYATTALTIDTNAVNGWDVYYKGGVLTNTDDGSTIAGYSTGGGVNAAAGTAGWGINLKANTDGSPTVGAEPTVTLAPGGGNTLTISTNYNTANQFFMDTTGNRILLAQRTGSTDEQVLTVSFVATASSVTSSGEYTNSGIEFVVLGRF